MAMWISDCWFTVHQIACQQLQPGVKDDNTRWRRRITIPPFGTLVISHVLTRTGVFIRWPISENYCPWLAPTYASSFSVFTQSILQGHNSHSEMFLEHLCISSHLNNHHTSARTLMFPTSWTRWGTWTSAASCWCSPPLATTSSTTSSPQLTTPGTLDTKLMISGSYFTGWRRSTQLSGRRAKSLEKATLFRPSTPW